MQEWWKSSTTSPFSPGPQIGQMSHQGMMYIRNFEMQLVAAYSWKSWRGSLQEAVESLLFSLCIRCGPKGCNRSIPAIALHSRHPRRSHKRWKKKTLHAHKCSQLQKGKLHKNEEACQENSDKRCSKRVNISWKNGFTSHVGDSEPACITHPHPRRSWRKQLAERPGKGCIHSHKAFFKYLSQMRKMDRFLNSDRLLVKYKASQKNLRNNHVLFLSFSRACWVGKSYSVPEKHPQEVRLQQKS